MHLDANIIYVALSKAQIEEERKRSAKNLLDFIKVAWHVVEPATPFMHGYHIESIALHLEAVTRGEIRNLLINIPPRHMKSLAVCVFWPVWEWIANPERRWLFASYAQSLSTRDSVRCRRLIESPWFQDRFGDHFTLCTDQNTKERFENDKGGYRIATSTGGAATGEGGDRVVVDDPHNVIDVESDAARESALLWWDQTMSTRLNDPRTGAKVIVMQRIHQKDLAGHVLEQGGYTHLCLPAEFEPARRCVTPMTSDWRKEEGQLLWPDRVGAMEIADFKLRLGPTAYAGQFQQRPTPAGGARFKSEWFAYWKYQTLELDPTPKGTKEGKSADSLLDFGPTRKSLIGNNTIYCLVAPNQPEKIAAVESCQRFAVMDPAGSEPGSGNKPCYTVIQVWDVTPKHDMLLVYQYRQQVQTPDATAAAIRIYNSFNCDYIGIEKDGIGLGIVQAVRRANVTVRPIKARGSNEARSQTAEIRMHAGQVYFPFGAPFLFELEHELLNFPRSQYADQVDALSHAAILVQKMGRPVEVEEEERKRDLCEEDEN